MLHVTNGDSAAGTLAEAGLGGSVLAWRDTLQEGPVPALPPAELRGVRAEFIAARGWAPRDAAEADLRARDEALAAALGSEPVVLWFEHDLYDQLQLIQILARVGDEPVEAILPERFLGSLSAGDLAALWPDRRPVTAAALETARAAWAAFTAPDPAALAALEPDGALPFLGPALTRLREEYPATTDGLARSERQALAAIAAGAQEPLAAFLAAQRAEAAAYAGDTQFFDLLASARRRARAADRARPAPAHGRRRGRARRPRRRGGSAASTAGSAVSTWTAPGAGTPTAASQKS